MKLLQGLCIIWNKGVKLFGERHGHEFVFSLHLKSLTPSHCREQETYGVTWLLKAVCLISAAYYHKIHYIS